MRKIAIKKYVFAGIAVAVAACAVWAASIYGKAMRIYEYEEVRLYVDGANGPSALRDSLVGALGNEYGSAVYYIWDKAPGDKKLRTGSFMVKPGERAYALARRIRNGQQDPVRITFNNVRFYDDLANRIASQLHITPDQFKAAADSVLSARGVAKPYYEGYFFPDTYEFYWNASPTIVVDKILANRDAFWSDERLQKASKLGLSPDEVTVVASIVEEETNKSDERPKVARLYLNRLAKGMKLQADPTVKYAVGDFSLRRILNKHLSTPSPYNTYLNAGLPPGPIRVASAATIDAVLNAPAHNYLYMCAKEDFSGYHNFAVDFASHNANARRYQQALNKQGIK